MALTTMFSRKGPTGFGATSTAEQVTEGLSLAGSTILVTGCNSGLGAETCRVLALRGAHVLGTARTLQKAREACAGFPGTASPYACDLSSFESIRACVAAVKQTHPRLEAIICNAGIMAVPKRAEVQGVELQLFTNHVGHFLLVTGLLECLSDEGRVVVLSSSAHARAPRLGIDFDDLSGALRYHPWTAYSQSKFANLLFAKELQRRFSGTKKTAYAVHPGTIATNIGRSMNGALNAAWQALGPYLFKSPAAGAATSVFAAVHPKAVPLAGSYLADCNVKQPRADAEDAALASKLWVTTEQLVRGLA